MDRRPFPSRTDRRESGQPGPTAAMGPLDGMRLLTNRLAGTLAQPEVEKVTHGSGCPGLDKRDRVEYKGKEAVKGGKDAPKA